MAKQVGLATTMRAVLQRVTRASVTVDNSRVSEIGRGLCVLLGIAVDDTPKDVDYMVQKILNLRVFDDAKGLKWKRNVREVAGEVLCGELKQEGCLR